MKKIFFLLVALISCNVLFSQENPTCDKTNPAVKAKIFEAEMTPWFCSAALMVVPKTHEKIIKTKM